MEVHVNRGQPRPVKAAAEASLRLPLLQPGWPLASRPAAPGVTPPHETAGGANVRGQTVDAAPTGGRACRQRARGGQGPRA